jgi:hypothetical protein
VGAGIPAGFLSEYFLAVHDLAASFADIALRAVGADPAAKAGWAFLQFFDRQISYSGY